jgi:hypothetical protein
MFAVVACQALLVQEQLRLDRMERRVAAEQARYERNRLEVARLESPERIVNAAHELGMVPPDQVIYLTPEEPVVPSDREIPGGGHVAAPDPGLDAEWGEVKPYLQSSP